MASGIVQRRFWRVVMLSRGSLNEAFDPMLVTWPIQPANFLSDCTDFVFRAVTQITLC
jgi:hypothetical protein